VGYIPQHIKVNRERLAVPISFQAFVQASSTAGNGKATTSFASSGSDALHGQADNCEVYKGLDSSFIKFLDPFGKK